MQIESKKYAVHAPLPATTVWVDEAIFYNGVFQGKWAKCKLIGISCIQGNVPVFDVITSEGYVFSDIPPHYISFKEQDQTVMKLCDQVYNNCLSEEFSLVVLPELRDRPAHLFIKRNETYERARYWFSLDFYQDNNWFHAFKADNGCIMFMPSHKVVFNAVLPENHKFPNYQKLRRTYSV